MGFKESFEYVLRNYGIPITIVNIIETGLDERGHPILSKEERESKGLFHVNTGNERLILGHETINYDAYILLSLNEEINEEDEIIVNGDRFRVVWLVENRTHKECQLRKIKI